MRRWLAFLSLLFASVVAEAQFTTVTGTVLDPDGIPYSNGTIVPTLISSATPTLNGLAYTPPSGPVGLDFNGSFIMNLASQGSLSPGGTTWSFKTCSSAGTVQPAGGTGPQCFVITGIVVTGATQSISAQLQAAALRLTRTGGGGSGGCTPGGNVNDVQVNDGAGGCTGNDSFAYDPALFDVTIPGGIHFKQISPSIGSWVYPSPGAIVIADSAGTGTGVDIESNATPRISVEASNGFSGSAQITGYGYPVTLRGRSFPNGAFDLGTTSVIDGLVIDTVHNTPVCFGCTFAPLTFADLQPCDANPANAPYIGQYQTIVDSNTAVYGASVSSGGGALTVQVWCGGSTGWRVVGGSSAATTFPILAPDSDEFAPAYSFESSPDIGFFNTSESIGVSVHNHAAITFNDGNINVPQGGAYCFSNDDDAFNCLFHLDVFNDGMGGREHFVLFDDVLSELGSLNLNEINLGSNTAIGTHINFNSDTDYNFQGSSTTGITPPAPGFLRAYFDPDSLCSIDSGSDINCTKKTGAPPIVVTGDVISCPTCVTGSFTQFASASSTSLCTIAAGGFSYASCTNTLTWSGTFADTNYLSVCTGVDPNVDGGDPATNDAPTLTIKSWTTTQIVVITQNQRTANAHYTQVNCFGFHP
jgi:hypothetical protein